MEIIQGSSAHTKRKEFEIEGVSHMRFKQFKNRFFRYRHVLCADVFCGTGINEVGGEIIEGSPMRLLRAYSRSENNGRFFHFWFSDIRTQACEALRMLVEQKYGLKAEIHPYAASAAINVIGDILHQNPGVFLFLILDPNGPKDFPKNEVQSLLSAYSKRVDVIPYISATTINRCIGARNKAGMDFRGWLGQIENFDEGFVSSLVEHNRRGWIRKPIKADRQRWTMLPTFGCMEPRNDWSKQGYVKLNSLEGVDAVKFYCGEVNSDEDES